MNLSDAVARIFTESDRAAAEEILASYDGPEKQRVQLAALALSGGDMARLRDMVGAAKLDYRDVLYWAEYPEESKSMTRAEAVERYAALGVALPGGLRDRRSSR